MEEVKYIQGDLVKLNGKTVKITFAGHELIEPIRLTPQILEDNGWVKGELKKEDNAHAYYYTYSKKGCIVELRYYPLCDMFLVYIGQEALMGILFLYVHQLQNLLLILGINSEMRV